MKVGTTSKAIAAYMIAASTFAADLGPIWVIYPGFCTIKKIYVTPDNDIYGQESGCTTSIGRPLAGTFVPSTGTVYVAEATGSTPFFSVYRPDGFLRGASSIGVGLNYAAVIPYAVSFTRPAGSVFASSLPSFEDSILPK